MKHRRVSLQNVAVLWHRTFPTEFHDLHLFCANIVDKRNFLNYWSVPLWNNSALWDKTISTKSCDTSPPPSYPWKYKISEVFWNTEWFAYEVFWYCEIRNFRRKIVIFHLSLSPLLSLKLCDKGIFLKNRRVPPRRFSLLWDKRIIFDGKYWQYHPLIHKIVQYQKFSETQKGSRTKYFGTLSQKYCNGKLFLKFFDTRKFLKHRRVPVRSFSVLRVKNFSTENRYTRLTFIHILFLNSTFCETRKGSPAKLFATVR